MPFVCMRHILMVSWNSSRILQSTELHSTSNHGKGDFFRDLASFFHAYTMPRSDELSWGLQTTALLYWPGQSTCCSRHTDLRLELDKEESRDAYVCSTLLCRDVTSDLFLLRIQTNIYIYIYPEENTYYFFHFICLYSCSLIVLSLSISISIF